MAEFRCIGPECEDSCCANWQIDVDRQHFVKIARLLVRTEAGKRELGTAFADVPEDKKSLGRYMRMHLREDGRCPFWADDKWCSIQRRFGERMLPDVCAHYPRSISIVDDELELSGQLSCPEVTRRLLLGENSCDLVEVSEVPFARGAVKQRTYLHCGDPYYERFLEARDTLLAILGRRDYPMRSRLFFTLAFADRSQPFFHRGTQQFSDEDWEFERASMQDAAVLDELHRELDKAEIPDGLALFTIARVLAGDVQLRTGGRFRDVVNEVLDSFHAEIGASEASAQEMWNLYVKRRTAKMARSGARIEEFFEKYCRQFWVRDWYVDSLSLYPHVQGLLVRVAVLRFLVISHPDEDIDRLAVRVFSSTFRGIEHHDSFLKLISQGIGEELPSLLHAASLLFV
jgi:lysine-N-methylase